MICIASCTHYNSRWFKLALWSFCLLGLSPAFAADDGPVSKTYDDSFIMSRVQLVGVIAGGNSKTSGIAVIKDVHSGRSYAVKTGESLPGVGHIVLTKVQREVAVFKAKDQEYFVRVNIGSSPGVATPTTSTVASETGADSEQTPENKGPGLFEKWAAGAIERGADLISLDKIKNKKPDLTNQTMLTGSIEGPDVRANDEQVQSEDHVIIEDDSDDVVPSI